MTWYESFTLMVLSAVLLVLATRELNVYLSLRERLWQRLGVRNTGSDDAVRPLRQRLGDWLLILGRECRPLGEHFRVVARTAWLECKLQHAGNPFRLQIEDVLGLKTGLALIGFILGIILFILGFAGPGNSLFLALAGYFVPDFWLAQAAAARQAEIARTLPDFMDTMGVILQAGMPLGIALQRVAHHMGGPLGQEIARMRAEMDLGVAQDRALHRLQERNECRDLENLVQALLQGDELGVPIARVFRIQAEYLRDGRVQRAREQAAKASPKITLATTFIVMPGVFLFIMAMVVLNLIYNPQILGLDGIF